MKTAAIVWGLALAAAVAAAQVPASREREAHSTRWLERIERNQNTWQCGTPRVDCTTLQLTVENPTDEDLYCKGSIRFAQPNSHGIADVVDKKQHVNAHQSTSIAFSLAPTDLDVASVETDCTPTRLLNAEATTTAIQDVTPCGYSVLQGVNIDDYYPPEARAEKRTGRIVLEFTLPQASGLPAAVKVSQSAGQLDLDDAAIRAIAAMTFKTGCPGTRFRAAVNFKLD